MKHRKTQQDPAPRIRTSHDVLAREASDWDEGRLTPAGFIDAPGAVPLEGRSVAISIRFPIKLVELLKMFAAKEGIGYQVLIKKWLDERLREELLRIRHSKEASRGTEVRIVDAKGRVPGFPLKDRPEVDGPHYSLGNH